MDASGRVHETGNKLIIVALKTELIQKSSLWTVTNMSACIPTGRHPVNQPDYYWVKLKWKEKVARELIHKYNLDNKILVPNRW